MGILTYIKLGIGLALILAVSYFVWNYQGMKAKIATQEIQIQAQQDALKYYEKVFNIEKETADVHQEINKAAESNDTARMLELFRMLKNHQRTSKGKAGAKADNDAE